MPVCPRLPRRFSECLLSLVLLNAIASVGGGCSNSGVYLATPASPTRPPDVPWCPNGQDVGENEFEAACEGIVARASEKQAEPVWCWAACAEMIHKHYGHSISQKALAERIHGATEQGVRVDAATYHEIMRALNPDLDTDAVGRLTEILFKDGKVAAQVRPWGYLASFGQRMFAVNSDVMIHELQQNNPVVVVLTEDPDAPMEHAYVLYRASYSVENPQIWGRKLAQLGDKAKEMNIDVLPSDWNWQEDLEASVRPKFYGLRWVELIDPYDGQSVRLDGASFRDRVRFMISKKRARGILELEIDAVEIR